MRKTVCVITIGFAHFINAMPHNPSVQAGNVSFNLSNPQVMSVSSTSNRSIVNWTDFSLDSAEQINFLLEDVSSAILNRVTGAIPSNIIGSIQSNGQVYLINPNGIIITPEAVINSAAFLASTLDVMDGQFLGGGDLSFQTSAFGTIVNQGKIGTFNGDIVLIGYQVTNTGTLSAQQGTVAIGAGQQVVLQPLNDQRIVIIPTASPPNTYGVNNSGYIEAIRAELKADGNVYAFAINHTGFINAQGTALVNGRVILRAEDGLTYCNGDILAANFNGTGGEIQVLGETVTVDQGSTLYAAASNGGGSIFIGGSPGGMDPNILNAENTIFASDATIQNDAFFMGNGGLVSIFAMQNTNCFGTINARGGPIQGNGGNVHVSGQFMLNFNATINNQAYNGMDGMIVFDPLIFIGTLPPGAVIK